MCWFITVAIPAQADPPAVDAILRARGRVLDEITPGWPATMLRAGDRHGTVLLTTNACDCGTVLGLRHRCEAAEFEEELRREARRLNRKRWSPRRTEARLAELRAAQQRKSAGRVAEAQEWIDLILELLTGAKADGLRLLLHFYTGPVNDAHVRPLRLAIVPAGKLKPDVIMGLEPDVLHEFRAGPPALRP